MRRVIPRLGFKTPSFKTKTLTQTKTVKFKTETKSKNGVSRPIRRVRLVLRELPSLVIPSPFLNPTT